MEDKTPEAILRIGIRRADASLRVIHIIRIHIAIIVSFVAVLWIAEIFGLMHERPFLIFCSALCAVFSVVTLGWQSWRARRIDVNTTPASVWPTHYKSRINRCSIEASMCPWN